MTTALTTYMTTVTSANFSTACQLITTSGSPSTTTASSKIGTSTGYGEVYAQGTSNAWSGSGGIGAFSKNGWSLDAAINSGNEDFLSGTWSPTVRLSTSIGSIVADIHIRAFSYLLTPIQTSSQIGSDMVISSQTINTTPANFTANFSLPVESITLNYFYLDVWLNITSNSTSSINALLRIALGTSSSVGYTSAQLVTPGYGTISSTQYKDGSARFKQQGRPLKDGKARFILYKGLDAASRFKTQGKRYKFAVTRFANAALSPSHDAGIRLALLSASRQKSGAMRFKQVSGPITLSAFARSTLIQATAVTAYMTVTNSTVLNTADKLITTSGSPSLTNRNTLIGTATGWGEVYSRGTSTTWYTGSVAPLPSGNGYIWEGTNLEGSVMLPGAWAANLKLNVSIGSIIADIHIRSYQKSGNTYTLIADMVALAQSITTTLKAISLTTTTTTTSNVFAVGDKLYTDVVAQIATSSTNSGNATLKTSTANSSTIGSSQSDILTTGYAPPAATSRNGAMRFKLSNARQKDAKARFRLSVSRMLDGVTRLKIAAQRYKDGVSRFKLSSVTQYKNGSNRFRLSSVTQYKNGAARFLSQGQRYQNAINRFRLSSVTQYKNGAARFLSRIAKQKDGQARFLQRTSTQYRDGSTRFKALLPSFKDGVTRFKQVSGTMYKSAVSRFKQSGSIVKNAVSRFKLSGFLQRDSITRFRQSVPKKLDGNTRLKAQGQVYGNGANRFRLNSPTRYRDASSRFRQYVPVLKNGISRFRQYVPILENASMRLRLISPTIYRMASTRFRQSVPVLKNAITRFRQSVPVLRNASTRFLQRGNQSPNAPTRLRLSGSIQKNGITRLLTIKGRDAITRFKAVATKSLSGHTRFLANKLILRDALILFHQSVPVAHNGDMRLRTWGAPSLSFALRLRQRVNATRSAVTRLRLSKTVVKNAACRLQTYHFNPRDGHIRFVLRPSTVSPISSATTEIVFRDGTIEMVFRS